MKVKWEVWRYAGLCYGGLPIEDNVDTVQDLLQQTPRYPARALVEVSAIDSDDLRRVRHGVLREARRTPSDEHIARRILPFQVACERHANYGCESAAVQWVALDDQHRTPESWSRTHRRGQVAPPYIALADYHSVRRSTSYAAEETKSPSEGPTSSTTRFIALVIDSGRLFFT